MQSFFYHILKDQRVYKKIVLELEEAERLGKISDPVKYDESIHLPYFQAALNEAMRMRPAVGLNITRHVPQPGLEINGTWFDGGTIIALNGTASRNNMASELRGLANRHTAWVLHRDKDVFGADADVYRPERWLAGDTKKMNRYMYQVSHLH